MIEFSGSESIPDYLVTWLKAEEPISAKLAELRPGVFVSLLDQGIYPALDWETQLLGSNESRLFRREVLVGVAEEFTWYARSLISETGYQKEAAFFERLKQQPLAKLLFGNPEVLREQCRIFSFSAASAQSLWLPADYRNGAEQFWGRYCFYRLKTGSRFVLIEIFLPGLQRCLEKNG